VRFKINDKPKPQDKNVSRLGLFTSMNPYLESARKEEGKRPISDIDTFLRDISRGR
jgi:hypothetical protein